MKENDKKRQNNEEEREKQSEINEASEESFPASDPPAWNASTSPKNEGKENQKEQHQ